MDVLFLSPADWDGPKGRFQHIAQRLAQSHRVLYVDGLGVRPLALRDFRRVLRKFTGKRTRSYVSLSANSNLTRVTPLSLPTQRPGAARTINRSILKRFLRAHIQRLEFDHPLVWISYPHPDLVAILDAFDPSGVVYDCVDDWSQFTGVYHNIQTAEQRLYKRADVVFATAPPLEEKARTANANVFLVPNGVDLAAFSTTPVVPSDVACIREPRIGFVGNIADWVDLDLVSDLAKRRPDWQFVFIGDYQTSAPRPSDGNLHWLGFRPYSEIPGYMSSFDVCVIPFVDNELTRSVDPLKLYEYLAAGKPVVSSPMPRSEEFAPVVRIAADAAGFVDAIQSLIDNGPSPQECIAAVQDHSWDARYATIARIVTEHTNCRLETGAGEK